MIRPENRRLSGMHPSAAALLQIVSLTALIIAIVAIAAASISISSSNAIAAPVEGNYVKVSASSIRTDELVIISILPTPNKKLSISIYDGVNTFRYNSELVGSNIGFTAQREAEHTLLVKDSNTGDVLETLHFLVSNTQVSVASIESVNSILNNTDNASDSINSSLANAQNSSIIQSNTTGQIVLNSSISQNSSINESLNSTQNASLNETLQNESGLDNNDGQIILPTRTRLVETDKLHYSIGELVKISITTQENLSSLRLNIVHGDFILRYIGDMEPEMLYLPKEEGAYRVVISSESGDTMDSFVFVVDPVDNPITPVHPNGTVADNQSGLPTQGNESLLGNETSQLPSDQNATGNPVDPFTAYANADPNNPESMHIAFNNAFNETQKAFVITDAEGRAMDGEIIINDPMKKTSVAIKMLDVQDFRMEELSDIVNIEYIPEEYLSQKTNIKEVKINGLESDSISLGIDPISSTEIALPPTIDPRNNAWTNVYAIDPSKLNASNLTVTVTATGTELFTCKDWDFANSACLGVWVKIKDVTPGDNYTLTLDSADPGFGESIPVPNVGWAKTTTSPADTVNIRICRDVNCTQTATNFQPGDDVYIWVNSTGNDIGISGANQLDIYYGADNAPIITLAYGNCVGGPNFYSHCRLNFTVPDDWYGWYYIDSIMRRGTTYLTWRTPITIGDEPVEGDKLQFFADVNRTRPADKFGPRYQVYVRWEAGVGLLANTSSNASIKSPHYNYAANGNNEIRSTNITWTNNTGPYEFNFSMPPTLSDGYTGWYWFEPNVRLNNSVNIPEGEKLFGRMIQYQNNSAPNTTMISVNSPNTSPISVGMDLIWNMNFSDIDEIDKHSLFICNSSSFNLTKFDCAGSTVCKNTSWILDKNITCSITSNKSMKMNMVGYGFICDPWNCSAAMQTNYSVYNDSLAPTVTLITPINPSTENNYTVTFNFIPEDDYGIKNCSLFTNINSVWTRYTTIYGIANGTNNYLTTTLPGDGTYPWNIQCFDYANNSAYADENFTLYIQGPPIIYLDTPSNSSYLNYNNLTFYYNVSYSLDMDTCELFINNTLSGTEIIIPKNTKLNFTYNFTADGEYDWNVQCNTTEGQVSSGDGVFNAGIPRRLFVDTVPPNATLILPIANSRENSSAVNFIYSVNDNFNVKNCTLYIDGAPIYTEEDPINNQNISTSYILDNGLHYWNAFCVDYANNQYTSESRMVNVSANNSGTGFTLYETNMKTSDRTNSTSAPSINLSTSIDNAENQVQISISGLSFRYMASAVSNQFMSNGILINPNQRINFSGYFYEQTGGAGYITWELLKRSGTTDTTICSAGNGYTGGTRMTTTTTKSINRSSCLAPATPTWIRGNETVKLTVGIYNSDVRTRIYRHYFDNISTYVLVNFTRLGFLNTNITIPPIDVIVGINDTFNITCAVNCTGGSCINTQSYVERNQSGTWVKLNYSGTPVVLNATDSNPHNLSTIVFPGNMTTFRVYANTTGTMKIRCNATSDYSNISTISNYVMVTVQGVGVPSINLISPSNNSFVSTVNVSLNFTPSSLKTIQNCSLYINGALNQTRTVVNNAVNSFNLTSPADGIYDWKVGCIDSALNSANSTTFRFTIDRVPPQTQLSSPAAGVNITSTSVTFIWNVTDNVDSSMNCNVTLDNSVIHNMIASNNNSLTSRTSNGLTLGLHRWNVTCVDNAGNMNWTETRNFTITNVPPSVTLLAPPNNQWTNLNDITFSYNITEPDAPVFNSNKNYAAMTVYRSTSGSGTSYPKYRIWNGTDWGSEQQMSTAGSPLRWVRLVSSPTQYRPWEKIALTSSDDGDIDAYVWNGTAWIVTNNLLSAPASAYRDFDIAYEQKSGRAIAIAQYDSTNGALDFVYRIWNGTEWSASTIIDDPSRAADSTFSFIKLASDPNSSRLAMTYIEMTSNYARAWIWNTTNWTNQVNITTTISIDTEESISIAFESQRGGILAVAGEGNVVRYVYHNTTSWNTSATIDPNTGAANTMNWLSLEPNPAGNHIMLLNLDEGNDLTTLPWLNNAWGASTIHDTGVDTDTQMPADFKWEISGNKGLMFWGTDAFLLAMKTYTYPSWSGQSNPTTSTANTHTWISLASNPTTKSGDIKMLGAVQEATSNALGSIKYISGSTTIVSNQFTGTQGTTAYRAYDISYDNFYQSSNVVQIYPLSICSLYLNGALNQSNQSRVYLELSNNFTIDDIPEQIHTWYVNCSDSDSASNYSTTYTLRVDRTPPRINLTAPQNYSTLSVFNVNFSFTPVDNVASSMTCNLTIDGSIAATNIAANNNTNTTRQINGLDDTNHFWNVTCIDLAGNRNTSDTFRFNISAPPTVRLISPTNASFINSINAILSYNATDNEEVMNCSLWFDGIFNYTNTSINMSRLNNFTIVSIPVGRHYWQVNCTDNKSQIGTSTIYNFTVDRTPPQVSLYLPLNNSVVELRTVNFNFSTSDDVDSSMLCNLTRKGPEGTVRNNNIVAANGSYVIATQNNLPDGAHTWNVTCWDDAGNINISNNFQFSVSGLPNVTQVSPAQNAYITSNNISLVYFVFQTDGINNCSSYLNGGLNDTDITITNNANNNFTLYNMSEGKYYWNISCYDTYDRIAWSTNRNFTIDWSSPQIVLFTPSNDSIVNNNSVRFNYTAIDTYSPSMICNLTVNGTVYFQNTAVNNGSFQTPTVNFRGGNRSYIWNVTCRDSALLLNTSETRYFNIISPPTIQPISPANNSLIFGNATFVYRPTDPYGLLNCSLIIDDVIVNSSTTITNASNNNLSAGGLGPGQHNWTIGCYDTDGEYGESQMRYISNDGTKPTVYLEAPTSGTYTPFGNGTFIWNASDDIATQLACTVYIDSINRSTVTTNNNSKANATITRIADGLRHWNVTCIDQGNNANTTAAWNFTVNQTPTVFSQGPANNLQTNNDTVLFIYRPDDNDGFRNCSLYINGQLNSTNTSYINNSINNNITRTLPSGQYLWYVECYDNGTYSNSNQSALRNLTINTIPPNITLNDPVNGYSTSYSWAIFNWTIYETFSQNVTCNVTINGTVAATNLNSVHNAYNIRNITNIYDGDHTWNVTCIDLAGNKNTSETRNFTIAEIPRISLNNPANNVRTNNATINFTFTPTDNTGQIASCSVVINGAISATSTGITNNAVNNITIGGFTNGTYAWSVNCTDYSGNTANSSERILLIDQIPPYIDLFNPINDSNMTDDVMFNWTVYDSAPTVNCNLTIDGVVNATVGSSPGNTYFRLVENLTYGYHTWNVTCIDDLGQKNTSDTRIFNVPPAELVTTTALIGFNNTNPNENETILIRANISNVGGVSLSNITVVFYDGLPSAGGTQIGNTTVGINVNQSKIASVPWNITAGLHEIFVSIDPFGEIYEFDKDNNNATKNMSILKAVITYPANATMTNDTTPNINFTILNYTGGDFTYRVYVDGTYNGQEGSTQDNTSTEITINALAQGIHRIIIQANDSSRAKNSTPLSIIVDTSAPTGVILTQNNTFFKDSPLNVSIRINDTYDPTLDYILFVNDAINMSGSVPNATTTNLTLTGLDNNVYILVLQSIDSNGNLANSTPITIYVDNTLPAITMNSPDDLAVFNVRNTILNFTVTDNLDQMLQCNLTFDDVVIRQNINVSNGSINLTSLTGLNEGLHNWSIACWDGNNAVMQINNLQQSPTRTFGTYIAPRLTLLAPNNNSLNNTASILFLFNTSDDTGLSSCSMIINGAVVQTKLTAELVTNGTNNFTVNDLNNTILWSINCTDSSTGLVVNASETRTLNIDLMPPTVVINTPTNTWFNNSTPRINITITDNFDPTLNWSIFVNGTINSNGTIANATSGLVTLAAVADGIYDITVQGLDDATNAANSSQITIYVDTTSPTVTLISPINDTNLTQTSITLNFTATDNMAVSTRCNLTLDGTVVQRYNLTNGEYATYFINGLSSGYHYWNASCFDNVSNRGNSATWRFYVQMPDFYIAAENITFSNSTPVENDTIQINATISNIGLLNATNVTIQFYLGNPAAGGTQIGQNISIDLPMQQTAVVSINYTTIIGLNRIYVQIDPPIASNGTISELNETNNIAFSDLWVGLFEVFAGGTLNDLRIADGSFIAAFSWNETDVTGSNVFVADSESTISFVSLQALGRNTTNGTNVGTNDFAELDTRLNTTGLNDSVNRTFTSAGSPIAIQNIIAYKRQINNIPSINSTNTTSFMTGILWDKNDGGNFYNGSQDIVFVTVMNQSKVGKFGTYDYEIAVPAKMRDYVAGGGTITFYAEIK